MRQDHEQPEVIVRKGWRYHHVGIPTDVVHPGEKHLPQYGMHVAGFQSSSYGIEWMRFDENSPLPERIRRMPHVAFEVDDIDEALEGKEVLWPPGSPSEGVRSAMITDNGALVEVICFTRRE